MSHVNYCTCFPSHPIFEQGKDVYCCRCGKDYECPAPPASDDEKSSKPIGDPLLNGPLDSVDLTQLQRNSKAMLHLLYEQSHQIKDLQQTTKFLAEQVKTLVDALADDTDPDAPLTRYMDGRPI